MAVFKKSAFYSGKVGSTRQNVSIWAKVVVFGQSGCIRAKLVVIGQKWLYSGKVVVFGQKWLNSGKIGYIEQSICILAKWFY